MAWRQATQTNESPDIVLSSSEDEEKESTGENETIPLDDGEQRNAGKMEDISTTTPRSSSLKEAKPFVPKSLNQITQQCSDHCLIDEDTIEIISSDENVNNLSFGIDAITLEPLIASTPKHYIFKSKKSFRSAPAFEQQENKVEENDSVIEVHSQHYRKGNDPEILDDSGHSSDKENVFDLVSSADSSVEVILHAKPKLVEPPKPKLKTKFLEELPEVPGSSSQPFAGLIVPESTHTAINTALGVLTKIISSIPNSNERAPEPKALRVTLYPHQGYGLRWLWWREHYYPGGGILADEMGLGKTIMILALVTKSLEEGAPNFDENKDDWLSNDKKLLPSRCTLIVVPPGVIGQWEIEIKTKTRITKVYLFHGPKRTTSAAELSRYDIILTTYQVLGSEIPKTDEKYYRGHSVLMKIKFERIVLDEGHNIRNERTNAAFACCRLHGKHRWIVTGTPIHNKPADMHSLVKFLRLDPFDDSKLWDYWIGLKKIAKIQDSSARLHIIGKALILRRTKTEVEVVGNCPSIPEKKVVDIEVELSDGERAVYDHLEEFAKSQFKLFLKNCEEGMKEKQEKADNYVAKVKGSRAPKRTGETNYTTIFTLILRLRQCCVLPFLIHSMIEDDDDVDQTDLNNSNLPEDDEIISLRNPVFGREFVSSKIKRLLSDLDAIRDECHREDRQMEKVVIVSQWTSLLDIIRVHVVSAGFRTTEISGKVKIGDRAGITLQFNGAARRPEVLLLSLAAGGVGLNLVGANHLFLMDLHWNPQLELQAQDRIHRFGQTKNVIIYRYRVLKTMEERVRDLQEEKLKLATNLLERKNGLGGGLTINEMRKLFHI